MKTEEWKDVVGLENYYQVSSLGNIRRKAHTKVVARGGITYEVKYPERPVKLHKRQHGYLGAILYGDEKRPNGRKSKPYSVHRLVAEAFIPNPNGLPEVNHINEDKTDNRAENLEWCTRLHNVHHGTSIQRSARNRINNSLTSKAVIQLTLDGKVIGEYPSLAEAQRQTGCDKANIHNCLSGRYTHAYGYVWKYR